jgi:hypothetical protein
MFTHADGSNEDDDNDRLSKVPRLHQLGRNAANLLAGAHSQDWHRGDPACPEGKLAPRDFMMRPVVCKKANPPAAIAGFIDGSSANWNLDRLKEFFTATDIEVIHSIH